MFNNVLGCLGGRVTIGIGDCRSPQGLQQRISHYGRNTHFRQKCASVPNFNFKYVYIKFEKLRDNGRIFEEITHKLASRENYASEEINS